jgi:tripartite ATP-independent transporter DctP family solute receptor
MSVIERQLRGGVSRRGVLRYGLAGVAVAATGPAIRRAGAAETLSMRVGTDSPIRDAHSVAMVKFKEEVEAKSNGRIKVAIFPDAQLGGNEVMINSIKAGTLDGMISDVGVLTSAVPEADIFSMPFLFRDTGHALRAANGMVGAKLKPKIEAAFGCAVLGWGTDGSRNMWNSKHPIRTPEDVRGLKMRVQASPIQKDTYAAFGALPTPVAFSELYTALQTKVVDGADPSVVDMISLKFYQVTKYLTMTHHFNIMDVVVVSKQFLSKLSPQDQEIVRAAGKTGADAEAKATLDEESVALKEVKEKGIKVFEMADPGAFVAKVQPVYDKGADRVGGKAFLEQVRKIA